MAEANGHDAKRGQIRELNDDHPASRDFKRQKSDRTILALQLGGFQLEEDETEKGGQVSENHEGEEVTNGEDEADCAGKRLQGLVEGGLNILTGGKLFHQIGYEQDDITEEQFENNIVIQHPKYEAAEGIKLGVHFRKHKNGGFIVRKVLEDGLLANKDIRPGDIVTHVGDTDIRNMSLADLQHHFWNLHFEIKFTLTIIRVIEDEDKTDGATGNYAELIATVKVTYDDDVFTVETEIEVSSAKCFFLPLGEDCFFISVVVGGNPMYLRAEEDMTLKAVNLKNSNDTKSLWKEQYCLVSPDEPTWRLLYNVGTEMTICSNITIGQSPNIVKMSRKGAFEHGSSPPSDEHNRLFIGTPVTEGNDDFYLQSVSHQDYFMCLSSNPEFQSCLEMATEDDHPKSVFRFDYLDTKSKQQK